MDRRQKYLLSFCFSPTTCNVYRSVSPARRCEYIGVPARFNSVPFLLSSLYRYVMCVRYNTSSRARARSAPFFLHRKYRIRRTRPTGYGRTRRVPPPPPPPDRIDLQTRARARSLHADRLRWLPGARNAVGVVNGWVIGLRPPRPWMPRGGSGGGGDKRSAPHAFHYHAVAVQPSAEFRVGILFFIPRHLTPPHPAERFFRSPAAVALCPTAAETIVAKNSHPDDDNMISRNAKFFGETAGARVSGFGQEVWWWWKKEFIMWKIKIGEMTWVLSPSRKKLE